MSGEDLSRRRLLRTTGSAVAVTSVTGLTNTAAARSRGGEDNPWFDRSELNVGHRGGGGEAPENTLFAFRAAVQQGADVLEFDVRESADGRLVAIHDETVDRTTDGTGRVDELTLAELQSLDAAHSFVPDCGTCPDRSTGQVPYRGYATGDREIPADLAGQYGLYSLEPADFRIPTVEAILETFPDTPLSFEFKGGDIGSLVALLEEYDRGGRDALVGAFDGEVLEAFREAAPNVPTTASRWEVLDFLARSAFGKPLPDDPAYDALLVPPERYWIDIVDAEMVADAHEIGVPVHTWTVDDVDAMRTLLDAGVDGIVTDYVSRLDGLLRDRRS
jgi:glycerophosphoryl diester phosphodiesterase